MSESFLHSGGAIPGTMSRRMPAGTGALIKGGYIVELGPGLFGYLPLGQAVIQKIVEIIRQEFRSIGGEEIHLPILSPAELWKQSGRATAVASELAGFVDSTGRRLVISPSHEESCIALLNLAKAGAGQLPIFFFQFQSKFRDEEDSAGDLVRAREFVMADGFSFHVSAVDLNNFFPKVYGAFTRIFRRLGMPVLVTEGSSDYAAGLTAYEFQVAAPSGSQHIVCCTGCGYSADQDVAVGLFKYANAKLRPMEAVPRSLPADPKQVRSELGVPLARTVQVQVFALAKGFAMALVRGDQALSKSKLARVLEEAILHPATPAELARMGMPQGFASPLQAAALRQQNGKQVREKSPNPKTEQVRIIVDPAVAQSSNLLMPGGSEGLWFSNSNFGRDYSADLVADISRVDQRMRCLHCGGALEVRRMEKVGQLIKMGHRTSASLGLNFDRGEQGKLPAHLGSYGIGVGRLLAVLAELRTDHRSLCWPLSIAPFKVHMICVGKGQTLHKLAAHVYSRIEAYAVWDDRKKQVLEKFAEAERLGIPVRVVIDQTSLVDGMVLFTHRFLCPPMRLPFHQIIGKIQELEDYEAAPPPSDTGGADGPERRDRLFGERMYS